MKTIKTVKRYYKADFDMILTMMNNCYKEARKDGEDVKPYVDELFDAIANSGLFHDAIGKPTDITKDYVDVTIEY